MLWLVFIELMFVERNGTGLKHYQCTENCGFQSVQTIHPRCKNRFLGFHTLYCNALSKNGKTKFHQTSSTTESVHEKTVEQLQQFGELRVNIIWQDPHKKVSSLPEEIKIMVPHLQSWFVCVSSHVLKLLIWTNKTFPSSLHEF